MNEHIDIAFTGAKIATHDNEVASTTVHGLSALYNIGQMVRYRVMCFQEQCAIMYGGSAKKTIISEQYYREMWKHSVLAGIDILSLLTKGFSEIRGCR